MMSSGQPAADVPQSVSRRESTFALIRADLRRAKTLLAVGRPERMTARDVLSLYWHHPQIGAVTLYRIAAGVRRRRVPILPRLLWHWLLFAYGLEIGIDMPVGGGLFFAHCRGSVVYAESIGRDAFFIHAVTLGIRNEFAFPTLGDNVFVGAGARILGGVRIGDGARIGANAVVISDVPPGATAVGVPARIRLPGAPADGDRPLEQTAEPSSHEGNGDRAQAGASRDEGPAGLGAVDRPV